MMKQVVLEILSTSRLGLSSREIYRKLRNRGLSLSLSKVNQILRDLQIEESAEIRGAKWYARYGLANLASNIVITGSSGGRPFDAAASDNVFAATNRQNMFNASGRSAPLEHSVARHSSASPRRRSFEGQRQAEAQICRIDRKASRWSVFRQLCDYYAECVRLDQRRAISATAKEEFDAIVCLDGALPNSSEISVRSREGASFSESGFIAGQSAACEPC